MEENYVHYKGFDNIKILSKTQFWFVYRGVNHDKKEIYHGIALNPKSRQDGSHCKGNTKAIDHWKCECDKIIWYNLSTDKRLSKITRYKSQEKASEISHGLEKTYKHPKGYKSFVTGGK